MLLASVGEIYSCEESEITEILRDCLKERDYIIHNDQQDDKEDVENEENANYLANDIEEHFNSLSEKIKTWRRGNDHLSCSIHLLGRVSTRIYTAFENISLGVRTIQTGELMRLFVTAFLNALLIEEIHEKNKGSVSSNITPNNVRTKPNTFYDNRYNVGDGGLNELPMTKMFCECPLLIPFICKDEEESDLFRKLKGVIRYGINGKEEIRVRESAGNNQHGQENTEANDDREGDDAQSANENNPDVQG